MSNFTLEQKLRTGHVKRWQIVRVAREQTIAEHMYRVYQIAIDMCAGLSLGSKVLKVGQWALMHDLPEVITGDIATPTKRTMRQAVPGHDPIHHVELSLDTGYRELYLELKEHDPVCLDVVKLADLLEAINFLMVEGMGKHADEVLMGLRMAYLEKVSKCRESYTSIDWSYASDLLHKIGAPEAGYNPAQPYPVTI